MSDTSFSNNAFAEYVAWQNEDKKTLRRINALIKSIHRDGVLLGMGKPEVLKGTGEYSRRIDDKNRLIYTCEKRSLRIIACRGHYDDK
jgi:toxin YoeB